MSHIGWVDFSSTDREQVSKILAMLKESGTLDELGIGQIRDAYADLLFPGFSTIQTRAKYLITVPLIFREYHSLRPSEKKRHPLLKYLKEREDDIARQLVAKHGAEEGKGIIGSTMVDKGGVSRRPSSVYWNAFRQFGIIKDFSSLNEFCHEYEKDDAKNSYVTEHEDGIDDQGHFRLKNKVEIPVYNQNWFEELDIELTSAEAEFLYLYIMQSSYIVNSIPSQIFKHDLLDLALEEKYESLDALTMLITNSHKVSSDCKNTLKLANEFSHAMEGPHIRYNIILAKKNGFDAKAEKYTKEFYEWLNHVQQNHIFYPECAEMWINTAKKEHLHPFNSKTVNFIKDWSQFIYENTSEQDLDNLVEGQAIKNKGSRSLLHKKINKDKWIGIRLLDYRWSSAIKILKDIQKGKQSA